MAIASENHVSSLRAEVRDKLNKPLVNGDVWFLIEAHWFKQCKKYLGLDNGGGGGGGGGESNNDQQEPDQPDEMDNPGTIDNARLFSETAPGELKDHLVEEIDYMLVPEEIWTRLYDTFGLAEGQQPINRIVREFGMFVKHCKVEVYYTEFLLADLSAPELTVKRKFSKADTLGKMHSVAREVFHIPEDKETRLWNKYTSTTYEPLDKLDSTIQDAGLFSGQLILIEQQNEDGTWIRQNRSSSNQPNIIMPSSSGSSSTSLVATNTNYNAAPPPPAPPANNFEKKETSPTGATASTTRYYSSYGDGGQVEDGRPGICGLSNLGNTCFMNSIIQGLSNTPQIVEYFENENYIEDINEDNPLGMKGEIARAFGQLIKDMWSGRYAYVVPRNFKKAVGQFAPQFSGYQQQDSQELLTFLLDGLHEDLNRIKKKPYVEMTDSEGKDDVEVAREAWSNYKKRNDSAILDIFHGLLKSTLVCPECNKVSVTFDPMCYLSLPLPVKKERQIEAFFVPMSLSSSIVQYKVTCPKNGIVQELSAALGQMVGLPAERLTVTDVYNHRFHKVYTPDEQLNQILDRDDIFIYEIPDPQDKSQVVVPVYMRERKTNTNYSPSNLFGHPLLVGVPSEVTYHQLYELILNRMSRYVSRPNEGEEWWKMPNNNNNNNNNKLSVVGKSNSNEEQMEVSGDSPDMPSLETGVAVSGGGGGAEGGTPSNSSDSPTSETSTAPNIQDDEMTSDDEWITPGNNSNQRRLFNLKLVNSYGNDNLESLLNNETATIQLSPKHCLALDWHPRARILFYNDKVAEEVRQDEPSFHPDRVADTVKKQTIDLTECLKLYTSQEKLGAEDAWYCPACKKHQQASKKFDLWTLPEVLIIHLKRFSYNRYWRDKIDTLIDFPIEGLDMTPYVIQPGHGQAVYDLIAVSNHYGGMGGGHYTAFGKNKNDGKWYNFDDSSVTRAKAGIVTKAAYVLFYQRRTQSKQAARASRLPAAAGSAEALLLQNGLAAAGTGGATGAKLVNGANGVSSSDEDMETN